MAASNEVPFFYKCTNYYNSALEFGVAGSDFNIAIDWNVIISRKDQAYLSLQQIAYELLPQCRG